MNKYLINKDYYEGRKVKIIHCYNLESCDDDCRGKFGTISHVLMRGGNSIENLDIFLDEININCPFYYDELELL